MCIKLTRRSRATPNVCHFRFAQIWHTSLSRLNAALCVYRVIILPNYVVWKTMYRSLIPALVFVSFFCHGEAENDSSSDLNRIYVYDEPLELPPYSDRWFIEGDLSDLSQVNIIRDGKSGDLSAPISIDCKHKKFAVTGNGLLYTSMPISSSEVSQKISNDVIGAVIQKVCGEKNT